jgi:hypothetical protein
LRLGFVDHEIAAAEVLTVERVDGFFGVFVGGNFDEGETARLPGEPVANEIDGRGSNSDLSEPLVELVLRRGKRKVANVELLHLPLLLPGTHVGVAERAEEQ